MSNATIRRSVVGSLVIVALAVTVWSAVAQAGPTPSATPTATPSATPMATPTACDPFPDDSNNELAQCSLDLGGCRINLIQRQDVAAQYASELVDAQAVAAQWGADLFACNAGLVTSNDQLSECAVNFAMCSDSLAQLKVDLSTTRDALDRTEGELDQALTDLAEATADSDKDGVRDTADTCLGTERASEVDGVGCSVKQFCAAIDASTRMGEAVCKMSDWQNDEPLGNAGDCAIQKQGRGQPSVCVPVP
ncbi:MAG: hypothetical protein IH881_18940 [Myxococcales bacterium]|nr:hypothetical protein [Myxococcales bacterium]